MRIQCYGSGFIPNDGGKFVWFPLQAQIFYPYSVSEYFLYEHTSLPNKATFIALEDGRLIHSQFCGKGFNVGQELMERIQTFPSINPNTLIPITHNREQSIITSLPFMQDFFNELKSRMV